MIFFLIFFVYIEELIAFSSIPHGLDDGLELIITFFVLSKHSTATHASLAARCQLFGIVNERGENDHRHADHKHKQTENARTGAQRRDYNLETGKMIEQLEQSHYPERAEQVPSGMSVHVGVLIEQEIIVDQVKVEPQVGHQIYPVEDVLEEDDFVGRGEAF